MMLNLEKAEKAYELLRFVADTLSSQEDVQPRQRRAQHTTSELEKLEQAARLIGEFLSDEKYDSGSRLASIIARAKYAQYRAEAAKKCLATHYLAFDLRRQRGEFGAATRHLIDGLQVGETFALQSDDTFQTMSRILANLGKGEVNPHLERLYLFHLGRCILIQYPELIEEHHRMLNEISLHFALLIANGYVGSSPVESMEQIRSALDRSDHTTALSTYSALEQMYYSSAQSLHRRAILIQRAALLHRSGESHQALSVLETLARELENSACEEHELGDMYKLQMDIYHELGEHKKATEMATKLLVRSFGLHRSRSD